MAALSVSAVSPAALAGVMSVMRNISPTWWRTLIDQKNGLYYFDSALSPQMVWVNLNQIDLKSGAVACAPSRLKAMRRCRAT